MKSKLSYDREEDVLYYNKGESVRDSLDIGNIYLEFSGDNRVVGIEVLEASEFISNFTGEDFSAETLENIVDAEIKMIQSGDYTVILLHFTVEKENEEVKESIGVNVPSGTVSA